MISLKQKQLLDRSFGKLLCYILSPIVRLSGLLLHLDHSLTPGKIHTIVFAQYYGRCLSVFAQDNELKINTAVLYQRRLSSENK